MALHNASSEEPTYWSEDKQTPKLHERNLHKIEAHDTIAHHHHIAHIIIPDQTTRRLTTNIRC